MGLTYIGCDADTAALGDLEERGFETEAVDLHSIDDCFRTIEKRLADRSLAAIAMIDTLEHLANGPEVLMRLQELACARGGAPLVVAVPNVTHFDLAAKLLLGRWDMTEVGLLDNTHVSFFSERRLGDMTERAGWAEVGRSDFQLPVSDQHFPEDAVVLQAGTPLHDLLFTVRDQASGGATVNEFVRVYAPLGITTGSEASNENGDGDPPFLSVLMRTQGTRPATLQEALLSLAAQTDLDLELILLPHDVPRASLTHLKYLVDAFGDGLSGRTRIVPVDGGGRARPLVVGATEARGRYVAILDDDDIVFAHWIETFKALAAKHPGKVLRSPVAEQDVEPTEWQGHRPGYKIVGPPLCRWSEPFNLLDHLWENHSPPCGWAVPRSAFTDQGI
jgi:hypothetical protein